MDDNISTFIAITGASTDVARSFLEMTAGNFERAIELFYENPDLASGVGAGLSANQPSTSQPAAAASRPNAGRQDAQGVIHIDSDDDTDMQFIDDESDDDNDGTAAAAQAAALAQEEEDMAMAKKLQEELYRENHGPGGAGPADGDDVRAPIARTTETLVAPGWGGGGEHDDGMEAAFLEQLRARRRQNPPPGGGPFSQRIWANPEARTNPSNENGEHARRLEDLFRPPYDLIANVAWDEARTLGKEDKKWILVNLQDMNDFNCQALNRDMWKDKNVRELVSENFIFLQYDKDFPDAQEFVTFYFPNQTHENPDNYPHVSIIDPRTGEQVKVWSGRPFPSAQEFHAELAEFLDRYSLAVNSKNPVAQATARKPQVVDVDRMTEDEMLEMALKNSLEAAGEKASSSSTPNVHDPDALTKATKTEEAEKGKEKEVEAPVEQSPWAQISSTTPHTEPANDPATTTRIQFRHPTGRVIRRFNLDDSVRRIYEWLKAEPLEGKEGIEFELKKMPQGQDLIQSLGETIAENGLKQGTVMIEFIED